MIVILVAKEKEKIKEEETQKKRFPFSVLKREMVKSIHSNHKKRLKERNTPNYISIYNHRSLGNTKESVSFVFHSLRLIIKRLIAKDSTIYTDKWKAYDGLVLDGYKHHRINHSKEFSKGKTNHINSIENFWGWSKMRLAKFRGLSRKNFYLHLKECEFRFNHRELNSKELYAKILEVIRKFY